MDLWQTDYMRKERFGKYLSENPTPSLSHYHGGIRTSLVLLAGLVKENEPEIHNKLIEIGLPLEYYFSEQILSMFVGVFNIEMTFRIWDIAFLSGVSLAAGSTAWILQLVAFVLLRRNAKRILKCTSPEDVMLVLYTYGMFNMDFDSFIREVAKLSNTDTKLEKMDKLKVDTHKDKKPVY